MSEADPYAELGVSRGASQEEIKAAYRRLALEHHPDRNPDDDGDAERFKSITRAYEILGDPDRRRRYDRREAGAGRLDGAVREGWAALADFVEVFESVVTGAGRGRGGRDVEVSAEISLERSFEGGVVRVTAPAFEPCRRCGGSGVRSGNDWKPCPDCVGAGLLGVARRVMGGRGCDTCGGRGAVPDSPCESCRGAGLVRLERTIEVDVPVGAAEGDVVRIPGEGAPPRRGGSPGDLVVELEIAEHDTLRRDGRDVVCDRSIPFSTAALGGVIEVETLEGPVDVDVPPGTESGTSLRLGGMGFRSPRDEARGDQYVRVEVDERRDRSRDDAADGRLTGLGHRLVGALRGVLD